MAYAKTHHQNRVILVPNTEFNRKPINFVNPNFGGPQLVCVNPPPFPFPVRLGLNLNPAVLARMDLQLSVDLDQFMVDEGLLPSVEEEVKRREVIGKLRKIVMQWVKRVAYQRRLPQNQFRAASATILTYGSYGLGVHTAESDIDALCVGPYFATMAEDFFIVLRQMLANRPEVSEILCVKDAKVPLMRFKFDGISIDLPYAQLKVASVPEDVDILNPFFLADIDETSWKSLSGVRANKRILQLVPNVEVFQKLLRCVKLWAKRRGVYGNLFGFFGGVHLAVLVAFVCQNNPNATLSGLIPIFFKTFAFWPWPTPVMLQDGMMPPAIHSEMRALMPIQLPCSPHEYCHSNITPGTFNKIRGELRRGCNHTQELLKPNFNWGDLFEPFNYSKRYPQFVKICLTASDQDELADWVGWVKSRFRFLLVKLEEVQGFCDPNPSEYVDVDIVDPNIVFYWGIQSTWNEFLDIGTCVEDFIRSVMTGYQGSPGKIAVSVVQASELPKNSEFDTSTKAYWRMLNPNDQMVPVYSTYMPLYQIGYLAPNGNLEPVHPFVIQSW